MPRRFSFDLYEIVQICEGKPLYTDEYRDSAFTKSLSSENRKDSCLIS